MNPVLKDEACESVGRSNVNESNEKESKVSSKTVAENYLDVRVITDPNVYRNSHEPAIKVSHLWAPSPVAVMAANLIERWGMVAAQYDGEDSAGRSKGRLLEVDEVVDRACKTAKLAYEEFERRGWLAKLPGYEEAKSILEERQSDD